ncbi:hypothetical protein SAMN06295910_0031 [Allosphingosinicella indica]|uniref:Lipoprotein n=2 Tax=Allosphingosinicella indica TaxID=941907 RepID=A0A1X7FXR7_9SPHN|nr:hypothetical protein SAMN06295910_0031 [Allosphingosinicella indica]
MRLRHNPPMRALILLLLLTACGASPEAAEQAMAPDADSGRIECALAGAAEFAPRCTLERMAEPEGLILVIRAPDGGFRRLQVVQDGRGVVTADGSETALVTPIGGNRIEVAVGADRYRLPATVK